MFILASLTLLIFFTQFFLVIKPMPGGRAVKIILSIITAIVSCKFFLMQIFGGLSYFAPELPLWLKLSSAWLYAVLLFFTLLVILFFPVRLLIYFFCRSRGKSKAGKGGKGGSLLTFWQAGHLILLTIALFVATAGIYYGTGMPLVTEYELKVNGLPPQLDNFRIVLLADLHVDGALCGRDKVAAIVRRTNGLNPDLIVISGDFVDGRVKVRRTALLPLRELTASFGVYGVVGNHEYYSDFGEWSKEISALGVRLLLNEKVMVARGLIELGGVTDYAAEKFERETPDLRKTFGSETPAGFRVLLCHQPRIAEDAAAYGVSLLLSGHTHGGMVRGFDFLVGLLNDFRCSGVYHLGDMTLVISNGAGIWSGFPIRFGRPAEICLLRLRCK